MRHAPITRGHLDVRQDAPSYLISIGTVVVIKLPLVMMSNSQDLWIGVSRGLRFSS